MMPSMLYFLLTLGCLLSSVHSLPRRKIRPGNAPHKPVVLTVEQLKEQQPTTSTLASNSNVTLQYVGLGLGIQNYTCSSSTAAPESCGAIATLFDITGYLRGSEDFSSTVPTDYLSTYYNVPCNASTTLSDDSCQESVNYQNFPILGKHYFANVNGVGVPSFDIYDRAFLSAQKVGDVKAPSGAFSGLALDLSFSAVDWLFLPSDGSSRTHGLSEAYRINTAGGAPSSTICSEIAGDFQIKYAAEYWFYQ